MSKEKRSYAGKSFQYTKAQYCIAKSANCRKRNPDLKIFPICAKTGEGVQPLCDWIREQVQEWKAEASSDS